jgi:hypothetical protein
MHSPEGGTFMDIPKIMVDPEFAKSKMPYLIKSGDTAAIDFWTKEWPDAQRSNDAGEVSSWVVSKWNDFQNIALRNILGQNKSRLDLYEIMNNQKILLVNLSKGALGEMPAKLLGMMFVMKFQAAAMQRVKIPEPDRKDFCLMVDEFQNFATESFESILSEARKFRLNLIIANQFMSQLNEKIRSAVFGNAGSFMIGRVGFEDAEQAVKIFAPVFDQEDLQKLPNFMAFTRVLINGYPSKPFTMSYYPPAGNSNKQLADAIKRLSAAKYGRDRAEVELEIHNRLNSAQIQAQKEKQARLEQLRQMSTTGKPMGQSGNVVNPTTSNPVPNGMPQNNGSSNVNPTTQTGSSFLDSWIQKREQLSAQPAVNSPTPTGTGGVVEDPMGVQSHDPRVVKEDEKIVSLEAKPERTELADLEKEKAAQTQNMK